MEAEILLLFSLKSKRLKRTAGNHDSKNCEIIRSTQNNLFKYNKSLILMEK
jgi:hypothetical protein